MHVLLTGDPWRLRRDEINRLTRSYILDVLFWERDRHGVPLFPESPTQALDWHTTRAVRRGLPHEQAVVHARKAVAGTQTQPTRPVKRRK